MGRYAIYGNTGSSQGASVSAPSSNAFSVETQKNAFSNGRVNLLRPFDPANISEEVSHLPKNPYINYTLDGNDSINTICNRLHTSLGMSSYNKQELYSRNTKYYNRFKLATPNDTFAKGFAHVFFTRPDCNILNANGTSLTSDSDRINKSSIYNYAWKNSPSMIKELVINNGSDNDFMMSLSNKAASFSLSDEFIDADTYGKTYKGYKIAFGRNDVESKTAGDFSITYNDDRNFHIYHLHKLWVDYISGVFQGRYGPKKEYIRDRILDYACACYYILTAEDGETIIFWSKYYGVFPTTIPSTQYSWAYGNLLSNPQPEIKYNFSFKEDFNPDALVEFNKNAHINGDTKYVPVYDPKLGHVGDTWVGSPYIELVTDNTDQDCPYTFKLRFKPK